MSICSKFVAKAAICAVFAFSFFAISFAQNSDPVDKGGKTTVPKITATGPKVTKIDIDGLKALLKPNGKPLLINFWATWCDPCREEFPDLVRLDAIYRGKIDFITVSLDDLADMNTLVPKFLGEMKAEMPAYLLSTPDESAAISMVSKDWNGNLPLTILFTSGGESAHQRKGKIRFEAMTAEIDKLLSPPPSK
jgi:thiol-disulfide isomerase/thioredoxin